MNKEYHIAEGVTAFSTTRKGGVSQGNYSEFNINDYCGDCAEHVAENRRKLADELGISTDHIILPHQVHGVEVRQVAGDYFSMPPFLVLSQHLPHCQLSVYLSRVCSMVLMPCSASSRCLLAFLWLLLV